MSHPKEYDIDTNLGTSYLAYSTETSGRVAWRFSGAARAGELLKLESNDSPERGKKRVYNQQSMDGPYAHSDPSSPDDTRTWEPLFSEDCEALKGAGHDCEKCESLDPKHGHLNKVAWWAGKFAADLQKYLCWWRILNQLQSRKGKRLTEVRR